MLTASCFMFRGIWGVASVQPRCGQCCVLYNVCVFFLLLLFVSYVAVVHRDTSLPQMFKEETFCDLKK